MLPAGGFCVQNDLKSSILGSKKRTHDLTQVLYLQVIAGAYLTFY